VNAGVSRHMKRHRWLRTDEREDAVRSLQWSASLVGAVESDPHTWKWQLVALHNAVQGFMVLALSKGNGLLALRPHIAKKWLEAYRARRTGSSIPFPPEKLDDFLSLYEKIKTAKYFRQAFVPGTSHDHSLKLLNELRNGFIHFTPKGWSLELAGLPALLSDVADVISWCHDGSESLFWYKQVHRRRTISALRHLRRASKQLQARYVG
jgi:hypothetical protein